MSRVFVQGLGAVSPAGWGVDALRRVLDEGHPLPSRDLARPGWPQPLRVRPVPVPSPRPAFLAHPRLRRASPITHYAVAAALEALGEDAAGVTAGSLCLGIVFCTMSGSVNYSRRFYDETLRDPATASPVVFPETVFNAPASHLAALLGTTAINYTLVGDAGTFLQGVAVGADWLAAGLAAGVVVVGAEEMDWLRAEAVRLFARGVVPAEGAGALYLKSGVSAPGAVELSALTEAELFFNTGSRRAAVRRMRSQLPGGTGEDLLSDSAQGLHRTDASEQAAWEDWLGSRISVPALLGDAHAAGAAWQCVAAIDRLTARRHPSTTISVVGWSQHAIGARFSRI